MAWADLAALISCGFGVGVVAAILGLGGGVLLVPVLVGFHYPPLQAVATSSVCVVMTTMSATFLNWRQGHVVPQQILSLAIPGMITTQIGVFAATQAEPWVLLASFGFLLIFCIYLMYLREQLTKNVDAIDENNHSRTLVKLVITGGAAGFLSGMFGVGGGIVLVPLQILFFGESIKAAVRTSLGVILLTSTMSVVGHGLKGNIIYWDGIVLGLGGMLGARCGVFFLHRIPADVVKYSFRVLLCGLSIYLFWKAYQIAP